MAEHITPGYGRTHYAWKRPTHYAWDTAERIKPGIRPNALHLGYGRMHYPGIRPNALRLETAERITPGIRPNALRLDSAERIMHRYDRPHFA